MEQQPVYSGTYDEFVHGIMCAITVLRDHVYDFDTFLEFQGALARLTDSDTGEKYLLQFEARMADKNKVLFKTKQQESETSRLLQTALETGKSSRLVSEEQIVDLTNSSSEEELPV